MMANLAPARSLGGHRAKHESRVEPRSDGEQSGGDGEGNNGSERGHRLELSMAEGRAVAIPALAGRRLVQRQSPSQNGNGANKATYSQH